VKSTGSVLFGFMPYRNVALAVVYSSPAGVRSTKLLQGFLVIAWHCFVVYTIVMARGLDEDAYTLLTIGQMIVFEVAFFNYAAPYNDSPPSGDWTVTITGVPVGVSQQTVAALLVSNGAVPIPFNGGNNGPIHLTATHAALSSGLTKLTPW